MIITYRKAGLKNFGMQEHLTIWSFFLVELASLFVFIWIFYSPNQIIAHILDLILGQVIYAILFYYAYQMRMVQIKLKSEDFNHFTQKMKIVKRLWIILVITLAISYSLEIAVNVMLEKNNQNDNLVPLYLKIITIISQIL